MPYVEGETLRARLERERQVAIADAVRIAREVAGALDYAHRHGVIHRDIKPENILLHDGQALVADFGIALAVQQASGPRMTQTGLSLGTPQYMSPEQAMGERHIDARSDIYALGAVLYEMLAGDPPFTGSSVQAIVAKVISEKPTPLTTVRDTVPPGVEHAVLTALAKLPADRFATAADFATALASPSFESRAAWSGAHATRTPKKLVVTLVVGLIVTSAIAAWGWLRPTSLSERVTRVAVALRQGQDLRPQFYGFAFDLSPDGGRLAYVGPGPTIGTTQVWIRPLDALEATPLTNTTGALGVQWSPDARALLVTIQRQITTIVALEGGRVVTLRGAIDANFGADGRIYSVTQNGGTILRQSVGGVADTVYKVDSTFAAADPAAFPNGDGALFIRSPRGVDEGLKAEVIAVSFKTGKTSVVGPGVHARLLSSGLLVFSAPDGNVYTAPFDQSAMRMSATPALLATVALGANAARWYPQISISGDGTIAFLAGNLLRQRPVWLDANGRVAQRLETEGDYWGFSLSPDGRRLAYALRTDNRTTGASPRGSGDVWVEELATHARTRLTTEWFNIRPSWSPDGKFVLYARVGGPGAQGLWERRADASEPERLVLWQNQFGHTAGDGRWLPDNKTLIVRTYAERGSISNLYWTTAGGRDTAHAFETSPATKIAPWPSPDGTLIAYVSDETRTNELYVQRFPGAGERLLVSKGGASAGHWSRDGRSLYYWDQRGKLMVASIASKPALAVTGTREVNAEVVPSGYSLSSAATFDIATDGRILALEDVPGAFELILVRNGLQRLGKVGSK
jgi:serine/threonine-protein kinase